MHLVTFNIDTPLGNLCARASPEEDAATGFFVACFEKIRPASRFAQTTYVPPPSQKPHNPPQYPHLAVAKKANTKDSNDDERPKKKKKVVVAKPIVVSKQML